MLEQLPQEPEKVKKPDDYKCGECGDFFPSKDKLWHHLQRHMADDDDCEDGDKGCEDDDTEENEPKDVKGQVSLNHRNKSGHNHSVDDDSEDVGTKETN